jgi:hypothetical protein
VTVQDLLPLLTGPVAALVVLVWLVWMQRRDITDLRRALEAERVRADSAEEAARTSLAVISSLTGRALPVAPPYPRRAYRGRPPPPEGDEAE